MPTPDYKKRGKIRDTFIFLFILIACIPILGLGTISLLNISKSHTKNVADLEKQTLINSSEITSVFFNTIIDTLSTNFDSLSTSTLKETAISWQQIYAEKFVQSNPAFLEVSYINPQGKEIAKYSRISTTTTMLYLEEFELFKKAREGEVVISDVHNTQRGQIVTIAVPSLINGTVSNVIMAQVSLAPLITSIEKMKVGNNGYVLLFDNKGTQVGSKNNQLITFDYSTWDRLSKVIQGKTYSAISDEDRYISPINSMPVVGSAIPISPVKKNNWAILVEWPTVESDIIIENFRGTVLITIFISIIIVIFVASLLANYLVAPIRTLQKQAEDITKGNFEKQVTITTNNELEELGDSFNQMSVGLKRLEELKNEFVYVAAHELRAPVTAIKGYMELIFDGNAGAISPEMEHLLSPVRKSNDRLVNLVNDLLQVARSEAGKLEIVTTPADIRKEILAILDEVHPLALKRNMIVTYNPQTELPLININTGNFKEIIMNFVSNAIKYGNDNGSITITHEIIDGNMATSIADNGRGISEEDQKHLFEKFFRAGDVKKTTIEGTGLGLFITKELVEKMGGTLKVSSVLGKGTTFTITFKIANTDK